MNAVLPVPITQPWPYIENNKVESGKHFNIVTPTYLRGSNRQIFRGRGRQTHKHKQYTHICSQSPAYTGVCRDQRTVGQSRGRTERAATPRQSGGQPV